jgi:hypothetical protein
MLADSTEQDIEVAVSPEVVPGELVGEDLSEGGAEVAQLVRLLERDLEVEVGAYARREVRELAWPHGDVGRGSFHRPLGEQQPVDVRIGGHGPHHQRK